MSKTNDKEEIARGKSNRKWKVYGAIAGIYLLINISLWAMTGIIAYPTQQHRTVAADIQQMLVESSSSEDPFELTNDQEFKALNESAENRYSTAVTGISVLLQVLTWIVFIGYAFRYLRRRRMGKSASINISFIDACLSTLLVIPFMYLAVYVGYPKEAVNPALSGPWWVIFSLVGTFVFSFIITYLVARIFEWRYEKKHSFVVE